jgi:hypothetical protein
MLLQISLSLWRRDRSFPEGIAVSPDGRLVATVNVRGTATLAGPVLQVSE